MITGVSMILALVMEDLATGQAASNGALQWANGSTTTTAATVVKQTMVADGYSMPVTSQFSQSGSLDTVAVTAPIYLLAFSRVGHIAVRRTVEVLPSSSGASTPVSGSGGGGGTVIVLHHFPMW